MKYTDCSNCENCLGITFEDYLICPKIGYVANDKHYPLQYCRYFEKKKKEKKGEKR